MILWCNLVIAAPTATPMGL